MSTLYRNALESIARLALEEPGYDDDPRVAGVDMALAALEWVEWRCGSRFTRCNVVAVGSRDDLLAAGWEWRDGSAGRFAHPRCPAHAGKDDPKFWPPGLRP